MLESTAKLGAVQAARAAAAPIQPGDAPAAALLLEPLRRRNAAVDAFFYDIDAIALDEIAPIGDRLAAEGAILVVPPSGGPRLRAYALVEDFLASPDRGVRALAVAGVGSSAIGAAAFARNVADSIGAPVAAVISGYGLADLPVEALGGFLWFGAMNSVRELFLEWDRLAGTSTGAEDSLAQFEDGALIRASVDTRTVLALVKAGGFDLLAGHSKGSLVISEALFELKRTDRDLARTRADEIQLVTIGARIAMPTPFHVLDIIGAWDPIGEINSRRGICADIVVPRAMHHTNTHIAFHLPVAATLGEALRTGGPWQHPQPLTVART